MQSEVEDVPHVVLEPDRFDGSIHDLRDVRGSNAVRAAQAHVENPVFADWGHHDPIDQGLDEHVLGVLPEMLERQISKRARALQEFIAHVKRCVRPGAVGQRLDEPRDALIALDEQNVSLANLPPQLLDVCPRIPFVMSQGTR